MQTPPTDNRSSAGLQIAVAGSFLLALILSLIAMSLFFEALPFISVLLVCVAFSFAVSTVTGRWAAKKELEYEIEEERTRRAEREAETQRQLKALRKERFEKGL